MQKPGKHLPTNNNKKQPPQQQQQNFSSSLKQRRNFSFRFLFKNQKEKDRGDNFPIDYEPNGLAFGS